MWDFLKAIVRPVALLFDSLLRALRLPEPAIPFTRNALAVMVVVLVVQGVTRHRAPILRPRAEDKSVADLSADAQESLGQLYRATVQNAMAQYRARTPGEAMCFLARDGDVDTVGYLLEQGVDINSMDRAGRTALSYAAEGRQATAVQFLLSQPGADVDHRDDAGGNAYLHALAAGNNPYVLDLLRAAGASIPEFDPESLGPPPRDPTAAPLPPLSEPSELRPQDILAVDKAVYGLLNASSGGIIRGEYSVLVQALERIDLGPQKNEPEVQAQAQDDWHRVGRLLLNQIIGSRQRAVPLYERETWRHNKLPEPIMDQVKVLRQAVADFPDSADEYGRRRQAPEVIAATRKLNGLMVHYLVGGWVTIDLPGAGAPGKGGQAALPTVPANAPYWVTAPLLPQDLEGRGEAEIQDMINELYAAAGMIFPGPRMNARWRALGYSQVDANPSFSPEQKANLDLLIARRGELRQQAAGGLSPSLGGTPY